MPYTLEVRSVSATSIGPCSQPSSSSSAGVGKRPSISSTLSLASSNAAKYAVVGTTWLGLSGKLINVGTVERNRNRCVSSSPKRSLIDSSAYARADTFGPPATGRPFMNVNICRRVSRSSRRLTVSDRSETARV